MNKIYADLHVHTIYSADATFLNGKVSPEEAVEVAKEKGLSAIAIVDHDSVDGNEEALKAGKRHEITVIPGTEITITDNSSLRFFDIHILGLGIDSKNRKLLRLIKKNRNADLLTERHKRIIRNLVVDITKRFGTENETTDDLEKRIMDVIGSEISRPAIASAVFKVKPEYGQLVDLRKELGPLGLLYVDKELYSEIYEAIRSIKDANGIAILAHPDRYLHPNIIMNEYNGDIKKARDEIIKPLLWLSKFSGIDGVEVAYPYQKKIFTKDEDHIKKIETNLDETIKYYINFCKKWNLLMSGGRDSHERYGIGEVGLTEEEFRPVIARIYERNSKLRPK